MAITRPAFETDRDVSWFDICTGSTQDKPVAYDRDLKGCGDPEYQEFRIAESANNIIDCVKTPVYSISISGIVRSDTNTKAIVTQVVTALEALLQTRLTNAS